MATPVANTVTATITKTIGSVTPTSTLRAVPQGGILEGADPSVYDPKNPIIIFIIQVFHLHDPRSEQKYLTIFIGGYNHHLLPAPPLSSLEDPPTQGHCGSARRCPPWTLGLRPHSGLYRPHLPASLHSKSYACCQCRTSALLVPCRSRSRLTLCDEQLESCLERWGPWDGPSVRLRLCDRIWTVPPIP